MNRMFSHSRLRKLKNDLNENSLAYKSMSHSFYLTKKQVDYGFEKYLSCESNILLRFIIELIKVGEFEKAHEAIQHIDPEAVVNEKLYTAALICLGKKKDLLTELSGKAKFELSITLFELGQLEQSREVYESVANFQLIGKPVLEIILRFLFVGNNRGLRQIFKTLDERDYINDSAYVLYRSLWYKQLCDTEGLKKWLGKLSGLSSESEDKSRQSYLYYYWSEQYDLILEQWTSDTQEDLNWQALSYRGLGDLTKALAVYKSFIYQSNSWSGWHDYGITSLMCGMTDQGLAAFKSGIEFSGVNNNVCELLFHFYHTFYKGSVFPFTPGTLVSEACRIPAWYWCSSIRDNLFIAAAFLYEKDDLFEKSDDIIRNYLCTSCTVPLSISEKLQSLEEKALVALKDVPEQLLKNAGLSGELI